MQPRWTHDDEAAFAGEILVWTRKSKSNVEQIETLEKQMAAKIEHIKQLRQWHLDDLNLHEARLSNRSADDVRIFTYATVIFLPLSFASSIFSMVGPPSHSTTVSFTTAAAIALLATVIFVLNAGVIVRTISFWRRKAFDLPDEGFPDYTESAWVGVAKKMYQLSVKDPLKRVLMAWEEVKPQMRKDSRKGRKAEPVLAEKGRSKPSIMVSALISLPMFVIVYVTRLVFGNLYDLVRLIFIIFPQYAIKRQWRKPSSADSGGGESASSKEEEKANATEKDEKDKRDKKKLEESEESSKREAISEARKKKEDWQQHRLDHFMRPPRIDAITKHLANGKTFYEARKAKREIQESIKKESERLWGKAVQSRAKAEGRRTSISSRRSSGSELNGPNTDTPGMETAMSSLSPWTRFWTKWRLRQPIKQASAEIDPEVAVQQVPTDTK